MDKKIKKSIALFMIHLIMILTLYLPIVFADLSNIEARGQDNIKNFIRQKDFIKFKATVSITGDSAITPNQVLLGSNLPFDVCKASVDGFECELRFPSNGTENFDSRAIPYTITLKNDADKVVDIKTDDLFVDDLPPTIKSFTVDQALVISGTVKFTFEIEDRSCRTASCSGKCSGIKKLELFETDGNFKETVTFNTNSCTFTDTFETNTLEFKEGSRTVFAKAFDRFDQVSSTVSASFDFDKSAPFIDLNSFKVVDSFDEDIGFFGPKPVPVIVKVDIKDSDLDKSSVKADLDSLNKNVNLGNQSATCGTTKNDITTCSWNINLDPDGPGLREITIEASDNSGNDGKRIINKNFELDDTGPIILSLATTRVVEGQSFAKLKDNTFIATLREEQVGLKAADLKLLVNTKLFTADACTRVLDIWKCTWNNVNFPNSGKFTVVLNNAEDRLGNKITKKFSTDVIVDSTEPKLIDLVITNLGGRGETFGDITKTGDKIQARAVLEEETIENATADFSRFILNAANVKADACIKTGEKTFVCSWTTSSIDKEGFIEDFIRFDFTDISGNTLSVNKPFKVLGVSGEETPDFWESSVICSPKSFDRETFPLINQRGFCSVTLTPKSLANQTFEDVKTLAISLGQCTGDTGFVSDTSLSNNDIGSVNPVIRINFAKQDAKIDELNLNCPIDIISQKGNNIVTVPEKENIDIKFNFFNLPVGEVSSSVQEKIDDAIDDAGGIWDFVGFLRKIGFYAQEICRFLGIWQNIVATYQLFTVAIGQVEDLSTLNPVVRKILYDSRVSLCLSTEQVHKLQVGDKEDPGFFSPNNKFCKFVNCQQSPKPNTETKSSGFLTSWLDGGIFTTGTLNNGLLKEQGDIIQAYTGRPLDSYMNVKDSLVLSVMTMCIPGIIYGLDKYRQIQCMYADCLQTAVGQQGLPVFACEDQKDYATCKYVIGEIFRVIPYTAFFNYYANLIRDVLSNPFKILGSGLALACIQYCETATSKPHDVCLTIKVLDLLGRTIEDVTSIIDRGVFKIRDDFCDNLEDDDDDDKFLGLF